MEQMGNYVMIACAKDLSKNEKLDLVKLGMDKLLDSLKRIDSTMEEDTLQIMISEGWKFHTDVYYNEDAEPFWGIEIGAKYKGKYTGELQEEM